MGWKRTVFKGVLASPYEPQTPSNWILTAAALAGTVASSLFGGAKARKAAKKAKRELQTREAQESAWYNKAYNTDYLDTAAGQNLLRRANEIQDNYIRRAEGSAAVGGATGSATAQAKEAANRTMGDAVADIGARDASRKQAVEDAHLSNIQNLSRDRQNVELNRAQQTTAAAQQASNAMMTAAASLEGSTSPKTAETSTGEVAKPAKLSDYEGKTREEQLDLINKRRNPLSGQTTPDWFGGLTM